MTWRDQQGPASFRGVPFFLEQREQTGGRRVAMHEFPFSEGAPFSEDLGRKARGFVVEAHLVGADYLAQRDRLIGALEEPGPGELVHPAYGTRRVVVDGFRLREVGDGVAKVAIDFLETSAAVVGPVAVIDGRAVVKAATTSLRSALSAQFLADYVRLPAFVSSALDALTAINRAVEGVLDAHSLGAQQAAGVLDAIAVFERTMSTAVGSPAATFAGTLSVIDALAGALTDALERPREVLLSLLGTQLGDRPPATTPSRTAERANFDAIGVLVDRCLLMHAADAISLESFDSFEAAVAARTALVDLIDAHAEATSDDAFPALQALQAAVVVAVPGEGRDLPHLQRVTPAGTVPSLVLAYRLYGHLRLEADVIARNAIREPGFIPGGAELEVLGE